jgi:hypothetical protein
MPTDAADVCSWGKTGIDRRIGNPTRMTQGGHWRVFNDPVK